MQSNCNYLDSMEGFGNQKTINGTHNGFTPTAEIYVLAVVVIITAIAAILGNALVQIAFWRETNLKVSSPATLVMVLAFADFCMAIFVMPFLVTTALHGKWSQSYELCVATGFINTLLSAMQFGVLFSISVNRFTAVSFPHRYQLKWKTKTTYKMLFLVFFHSLAWSVMPFFGWGGYDYKQGTLFCNVDWSRHKAHSTCLLLFCYVIPTVVATVLYTAVFLKVRKISQNTPSQSRNSGKLELMITTAGQRETSSYSEASVKSTRSDSSLSPGRRGKSFLSNSRLSHYRTHKIVFIPLIALFYLPITSALPLSCQITIERPRDFTQNKDPIIAHMIKLFLFMNRVFLNRNMHA